MKKRLPNNEHTHNYLLRLPKYYVVVLWARYAVIEIRFSGQCDKNGVPLVWDYTDMNGTTDEFILKPITHITSGGVYGWTISESAACKIADALNRAPYEP